VASTLAPDVGPVRPSLGTTVGLELGSTSTSAPSQNTAPTGDGLGTVVNPNVAGSIVATTDTKVGPAIASSSATNVGSALTTSGSAANVGIPVTISGFAANISGLAANVGPVITSGTTVAASSLATTVGVSGTIFSSATNAGATTATTTTSSAATIPPTVIPAVGTAPVAPCSHSGG